MTQIRNSILSREKYLDARSIKFPIPSLGDRVARLFIILVLSKSEYAGRSTILIWIKNVRGNNFTGNDVLPSRYK